MRNSLLLVGFLLAAAVPRARAEKGRADALKNVVNAFPALNPAADPDYMNEFGDPIPDQLAKCRYKPDETESIEKLVALFDQYISLDKQDKSGLLAAIKRDFPDMKTGDYLGLKMGIMAAPDVTKSALINESCPLLLKQHYDNGARRADLIKVIDQNRAALEAAKAK